MFGLPTTRAALRPLAGDLRQLASVRRITLDDGPERGVRALAFSSGGGLDFWALSDRSLDIGPLWFRGTPVAWQGPAGFVGPALLNAHRDDGRGIERCFSGLLVTCGLDHIRKPPGMTLHGGLPLTPARVISYDEQWDRPDPILSCEGEITQWRLGGEALRLYRRIEVPIGGTSLRIVDRIENLGPNSYPVALLYHLNFGFPVVQSGSALRLGEQPIDLPAMGPVCWPAGPGPVTATLTAPIAGAPFEVRITFDTATLPYLQVWRNPDPGTSILAIEPCTSQRLDDGGSAPEQLLEPGAQRAFTLELAFATDAHGTTPHR